MINRTVDRFVEMVNTLSAALAVVEGVQKQMGNIDIPIEIQTIESILEEVKDN